MSLIKTNVAGLMLDTSSNVVINNNDAELQAYRTQILQSKEISSLKDDIEMLKAMLLEMRK